jgi:Ca2+/H+ antiporter
MTEPENNWWEIGKWDNGTKFLAQLVFFLLSTIIAIFVIYYQIINMFELTSEQANHISIVSALIFSSLLLLSIRTHKKKEKKEKKNA